MRGAEVVHEGLKHVHVSGHGSEEELKLMLSLVRPRYFVPIHGEYRQLARHARVAKRVTGGDRRCCSPRTATSSGSRTDEARIAGRVTAGRVLIDGTRTGEVGDEVLRDRRHLSGDGLVVPVLAINRQSGALEGVPDIITRGFVVDERSESVLADAGAAAGGDRRQREPSRSARTWGSSRRRVRVELQRVIRKRSGRRPLVLPVVMEI